jgi:lipopolysaccharide transport system permease protein
MLSFASTPTQVFVSFWRNRSLLNALARREVVGRYRGSFMGILWSFIHPVFMLSVYTFVFSVIFKARWGGGGETREEFALVLFAGLLVFNVFAECINQAPELILSNTNYVKKVVFPLEILPGVLLLSALFHCGVSFVVWILAYVILFGMPHITVLLFPLVLLPLALFVMGLSWLLASLGVYVRDLAQFIRLFTSVLMFLTPIFYPATALPEEYRGVLFLNPLTPIVEQARNVLCWGKGIDMADFGMALVLSALVAWLGFAWFQKTRKGFADVL